MKRSPQTNPVAIWRRWGVMALAGALTLGGCYREPPAKFDQNLVHAYRVAKESDAPLETLLSQSRLAIEELFGTPEAPRIPAVVAEDKDLLPVSLERLHKAAVEPNQDGTTGIYQKYNCHTCHGISGDGHGILPPTGDVYPRDYRMGVFKFKSTPRGSKPTRADLARTIKHGIPGTVMKGQDKATDEEIQALVDYVIFLSWRGQVERAMLNDASEIDFAVDALYDPNMKNVPSEEEEGKSKFEVQQSYINDHVTEIAEAWMEAEEKVVEVTVPEQPPLLTTGANLNDPEIAASIERGKALFLSPVAACSKCHGAEGRGDGQNSDFDDWTKDWAKDWVARASTQPTDTSSLTPLMARGAFPPRVIRPRNFREGLFRGGSEPQDLYRRILNGIDGTPMPGATLKTGSSETGLTPSDIWDLVNFVRSLALAGPDAPPVQKDQGKEPEKKAGVAQN